MRSGRFVRFYYKINAASILDYPNVAAGLPTSYREYLLHIRIAGSIPACYFQSESVAQGDWDSSRRQRGISFLKSKDCSHAVRLGRSR